MRPTYLRIRQAQEPPKRCDFAPVRLLARIRQPGEPAQFILPAQ